MTNCINCGAPASNRTCAYCGTPSDVPRPEADRVGFDGLLAMVQHCKYDDDRTEALQIFAKRGKKITAGQARIVLSLYIYDDDRTKGARALRSLILNPADLVHSGDLFKYDDDRNDFMRIALGIEDDDDGDLEDPEAVDDNDDAANYGNVVKLPTIPRPPRPPSTPVQQPPSSGYGSLVMGVGIGMVLAVAVTGAIVFLMYVLP